MTRRAGGANRAFTLVELLVVIGIIGVLVGILIPTLSKARQSAIQIKCAANLRQWGQSFHAYAADNKGKLPTIWGLQFNTQYTAPSVYWANYETNLPADTPLTAAARRVRLGELNIVMMAKYVKGFNQRAVYPSPLQPLSGPWVCPAVGDQSESIPGWFAGGQPVVHSTHIHYAYYYGAAQIPATYKTYTPYPNDFADKNKMSPDRIWMTDLTLYNGGAGAANSWVFNHGRGNANRAVWSVEGKDAAFGRLDGITGINVLTGDGSVRWKGRQDMNIKRLIANPADPLNHRFASYYY